MFNKKLFLWVLIIFCVLSNFLWLLCDRQPPEGNDLQDLLPGIEFYHYLKDNGLSGFFKAPFFSIYPPLVPFSYTLFYLIFGTGTEMELMVNSFYLSVMLLSIYGIGRRMFNEKIGLLSAFILSSFPSVIAVSRLVYAEFHLMCLTVLSIYLLLRTDYFTNRKYSIALGISLALVALAKWEFPPMLIGPFAVILYRARIIDTHIPYRTKLSNFFLSLFIGFLLSGFWYVPNFRNVYWRLFINPNENIFHFAYLFPHKKIFSFNNFLYYIISLINSHIFLLYFAVLVISLVYLSLIFISNRNSKVYDRSPIFVMASWLIIPYLSFTIAQIKGESHMLAVLPPASLIISAYLFKLKKTFQRFILLATVIYGFLLHAHPFYNIPLLGYINHIKLNINFERPRFYFNTFLIEHKNETRYWPSKGFSHPDKKNWLIKEISEFIKNDTFRVNKDPIILILSKSIEFNRSCFQYVNLLNFKSYVVPSGNTFFRAPPALDIEYIVLRYDAKEHALIWKELVHSIYFEFLEEKRYDWINEYIIDKRKDYFDNFTMLKEFVLPDGATAKIFRVNKKITDVNI